jgi:hypothetical protein
MKSAARNVPQPFQVAAKSKWVLFEAPATWKGCGTFSEERTEQREKDGTNGIGWTIMSHSFLFVSSFSLCSVLSLFYFVKRFLREKEFD